MALNDDNDDTSDQAFDELLTISDKSTLIPKEEPAVQSWEELKTVCCVVEGTTQLIIPTSCCLSCFIDSGNVSEHEFYNWGLSLTQELMELNELVKVLQSEVKASCDGWDMQSQELCLSLHRDIVTQLVRWRIALTRLLFMSRTPHSMFRLHLA